MTSLERLRDQTIDRFWETVPPLWNTVRAHIRSTAAENFDVTVEQFHVLRYVRRGMRSASELATARNISRPAISQAVEVLVKKKLLTRVQSKQDRRYMELTLTPAGNDLLDAVFKNTHTWMKKRMNTMSADELDIIVKSMEILRKMLD
jgi:DNA-binding MarR family transcriptional regulator